MAVGIMIDLYREFNTFIGNFSHWIVYGNYPSQSNSNRFFQFINLILSDANQEHKKAAISYNIKASLYNFALVGAIVRFVESFFNPRALISCTVCYGITLFINEAMQRTCGGLFMERFKNKKYAPFKSLYYPF